MYGVPKHHYYSFALSSGLIIPIVRGIDLKFKHTRMSVMHVTPCVAEPLQRVCNLVAGVIACVDQEPWGTLFFGPPFTL